MRGVVVVPTYNERDNIGSLIEAVLMVPGEFDILVVDDSSPDGTAEVVTSYAEKTNRVHLLKRTGNRGFGPSYIDGFKYAISHGYEAVFTMDADLSHDPQSLPDLAKALETHDVVMGSRYVGGKVSVVNWPLSRLILSVLGGKYVRLITGLKTYDPTGGFRAYRPYVLEGIGLDTLKSNGYSFLVETLFRAQRCGFSVAEIPIIFTERREGQSKMSKKIMFEAVLMPWRLRFGRRRPPARKENS